MLEEYALACTAFADDGRYLAIMDLQIDLIEDRPVAKTLGNVFKFD